MYVLKILRFVALASVCVAYADVESEIRDNELLIDTLEKVEKGESSDDLQKVKDKLIEKQNALLAKKAAGSVESSGEIVADQQPSVITDGASKPDSGLENTVRKIVKEELAKLASAKSNSNEEKSAATEKAAASAPELPEQKSDAMAQYELALSHFNKSQYKLAASGFGRIIKAHPKDPISTKALVHLAYCLEKQGELDKAAVVCEEALKKKLDEGHKVDCLIIRLRNAHEQKNSTEAAEIIKTLKESKLNDKQKETLETISAKNNITRSEKHAGQNKKT